MTGVAERGLVKRRIDGSIFRRPLFLLAALPAVYLFFAIQRGAITVPYWDTCALINVLAPWYDGDFHIAMLWAPQNQARPLVYRLVMGANAILTDWDVRSEFMYIYASFYGVFALHAWGLRKVAASSPQSTIVFPLALLLVSLIVFSPVSDMDQWWSVMFILDGANFLIILSFLTVFLRPESRAAHFAAAAACWAAAYTMANGIFAMLSVMLVFQLTSERLLRPNRWAVFWAVNLAVLLICYLPGLVTAGPRNPSLLQLAEFVFVYLGIPFRGLLSFPYHSMFDQPTAIAFSALCGLALLSFSAILCWDARVRLRARNPAALILFGFTMFALISAIVTGWGRANFPPFTVGNGNASRYTIFGAYLMLGPLYYLAAGFAEGWWKNKILAPAGTLAAIIFVALSTVSYCRAKVVYNNAHAFNQEVASAYRWGTNPTPSESVIYPDPKDFSRIIGDMQRLELGPFSNRVVDDVAPPAGNFQSVFMLSRGADVSENLTASKAGLKDISITFAKPNGGRTVDIVQWRVSEVDNSQAIASGTINAADIQDWEVVRLRLPYIADSEGREYRISFSGSSDESHALVMPLYTPAAGQKPVVTVTNAGTEPKTENLSMNLVLAYAD